MKIETQNKIKEILEFARDGEGNEIFPFMFQPRRGSSNTVSAAIRMMIKSGLIECSGKDGVGNPVYRATPRH